MKGTLSLAVAVVVLCLGGGLTAAAAMAGASGWGADDSLSQQVSLRNGSAGSGRVFIGGGLHGGK
ncbi:MAG: hypothetical protein H6737_08115 [Alphaproteobacteria bacterium]|nr:hypothetical protein [Alphaproteobacteria bacterium]